MQQKQAFTLIELLVVVLIIGILAAVAVPQYQKAVEKSRALEALVLARALKNAEEVYYWANGEYTMNLEELDIEIEETKNFRIVFMGPKGFTRIALRRINSSQYDYAIVFALNMDEEISNAFYCVSEDVSDVKVIQNSINICRSIGTTFMHGRADKEWWRIN
ncbi:MAG: pilin [Elusimicrobiaceae bacterium]|nr:pilin [Elusimicrobiaceae bacterium]